MAEGRLVLVDFCKGALRISKRYDLQTPLDVVEPVAISSMGCQPLVSHVKAANNAILSRVQQRSGAYVESVLTTTAPTGLLTPADNQYSAFIGGIPGAVPISGSDGQEFPLPALPADITYTIEGIPYAHIVNGVPQNLSSDPNALRTNTQLGRGAPAPAGGMNTILPDGIQYQAGVDVRYYQTYYPTVLAPFDPNAGSLGVDFVSGSDYSIDSPAWVNFGQTSDADPTVTTTALRFRCAPCLKSAPGGEFPLEPVYNDGPSLNLKNARLLLTGEQFTVPGFGGGIVKTVNVAKSLFRGFMCVYVNAAFTSNVSVSPSSGGSVSSVGPIHIQAGATRFPTIDFDTVYQFDITSNVASFTFNVTGQVKSMTWTTPNFFNPVTAPGHYCWEVFLHIHATGNIEVPV